MAPLENSLSETETSSAALQMRWSMPALMHDVKRDRSSAAFAMEKLDQATINLLFEQQRTRRDRKPCN